MGSAAIRRANSSVRSPSSSVGKILLTIPSRCASSTSMRVAREHQLLGLAGPELPRVREVLHAAHPQPRADHVGEPRVLGRHDQVARPHEHEAGRVDGAVHLRDRDLAQVAPALGVLEEVVPLLEHPVLGALAGTAVDRERGVLVGAARRRSAIASVEPRSWPDEKIGPTPPRITTRTVSSASARRNASSSSTSSPRFCAFAALLTIEHDPRASSRRPGSRT